MSLWIGAFNKSIADEMQAKLSQPRKPIALSDQQKDILLWADQSTGSLNIIARAGCGKSTTLLELARQLDSRCYASTYHSIGLKIWRDMGHRSEIDGDKLKPLARAVFPWDKKLASLVRETVSLAKQAGFGVRGCPGGMEQDWANLIDYYQIDDEVYGISNERFISECAKVYQKSIEMCTQKESIIDFDDMLLAPIYFHGDKAASYQYDWVMTDEAQDTNPIRRRIAKWILKPNGRMVNCGDPCQAIYHFCGASSNAMDLIKADMAAAELPLNVTYRCPSKIVAMAQEWVPDFTAHPSAPEGTITVIDHTDLWLQRFSPDDAILCRNTRPLVGIAVRLREMGIACVVEGQSGQAIINLIQKWGDIGVQEFMDKMTVWEREQELKWQLKGRHDKVEMINDRCGTIRSIAGHMQEGDTTRKLVARVQMLFGDDKQRENVLRLCTIHRSKGREWERVFLIGRGVYQPSKYAVTDEEVQQEKNLIYVAITRVKEELVEVDVPAQRSDETPWWEA
jgi:superfamily I DNA/RNA helicase